MKRIEVKLSLAVVAPLLDIIKAAADELVVDLAAPINLKDIDKELREFWHDELLDAQNTEVQTLLSLFDSDFFANGVVAFDAENAETVVRACAAIRLRLRDHFLQELPEDLLEGEDVEIEDLPEAQQKPFMCYIFLATIQELVIQHLDSAILGS